MCLGSTSARFKIGILVHYVSVTTYHLVPDTLEKLSITVNFCSV